MTAQLFILVNVAYFALTRYKHANSDMADKLLLRVASRNNARASAAKWMRTGPFRAVNAACNGEDF